MSQLTISIDHSICFQEVAQSTGITSNKAKVTSSNPPSSFLCRHVKKKKKKKRPFYLFVLHKSEDIDATATLQIDHSFNYH
jgi:hypothetical protein